MPMDPSVSFDSSDPVAPMPSAPLLSVTTPTYNRPEGLAYALRSVMDGAGSDAQRVEIIVSDNSHDDRSHAIVDSMFRSWQGRSAYVHHVPSLSMTANHNACLELATGAWNIILHDDDYLLAGGLSRVLDAIDRAQRDEQVLLFGAHVVNERGKRLRHQRFTNRRKLDPERAMRRLLTHSSFVRMPAICVRRDAYRSVGPFDDTVGGAIDSDMWIRLFARYGVTTIPMTTCAYVVHTAAATERTFTPAGIAQIDKLFHRAELTAVLTPREVRRRQRVYVHQFVLAGCFRRMRRRDWNEARRVLSLFALPDVARLGWSWRWAPVRVLFWLLTAVMSLVRNFARSAGR